MRKRTFLSYIQKPVNWFALQINELVSISRDSPFSQSLLTRKFEKLWQLFVERSKIQNHQTCWNFLVKSVRIWSFSGPYFPAFWLNKVNLHMKSECQKIRTKKKSNMDTFYIMINRVFLQNYFISFKYLSKILQM